MQSLTLIARLRRPLSLGLALLALLLARGAPAAVEADDIAALNAAGSGALLVRAQPEAALAAAPLVDTRVEMHVSGLVARVSVRQTFRNPSSAWLNGVYVFPLPEKAAVDRLRLTIGQRVLEGEIQEREAARRTYEAARDAGRKASLVEQQRPNLFTNSVANIGPGEQVVVSIEYQQSVGFDAGWYSLRFPLTVGVRYIPGTRAMGGADGGGWSPNTERVPDASHITPPMTAAGEGADNPVQMDITLAPGMPLAAIESPHHALKRDEPMPRVYHFTLAAGSVAADRDFELRWRGEPGASPRAALFSEDRADARYGLLLLMPPELAAAAAAAADAPREIVYVIDTSGSMAGTSIAQARAALLHGLDHLAPGDRFNVVQFNSVVDCFAADAVPASADNLTRARAYVRGLEPTGGTEMAAALNAVLNGDKQGGALRQVVFMTDGSVGNESELLQLIDQRLGDSRLFTVGIGSAPNSYFMAEAAANGRGTYTYIGAVDEVETRMDALFRKLATPVLTDIEIHGQGEAVDMQPPRVRDLYADEPLLVSLRQAAALDSLELRGRLAGKPWSARVPLTLGAKAAGLDIEWARQKIGALARSATRGADADAVKREITALGLRHHIVTAHTSLVAVDVTPSRPATETSHDSQVPNKMPAGWTMPTPGASLPRTATPMALEFLLGSLSALAAVFFHRRGGRRA